MSEVIDDNIINDVENNGNNGAPEGGGAGSTVVPKAELKRRQRAMRTSQAVFKIIDVLYNQAQNACPYINSKNSGTIECKQDVPYSDAAKICTMDVYRVPSEKKQPAVILIHGGGFSAGDKKYRKGQSQFLAINGFTVFCLNYGLAPEYIFPEPLRHLIAASDYIYDNADEFGIDSGKIIVAGDSAGGYFASMLAALSSDPDYGKIIGAAPKFRFVGTLLNCGLYDMNTVLNTKYFLDMDEGVFLNFIGISKKEIESFPYKNDCMPFEHITSDFPPSFVIYSPVDIFCGGQGQALIEKLSEYGVYFEYYASRHSRSNHCFSLTWRGEDATAANELMLSFAKRLVSDRIKL